MLLLADSAFSLNYILPGNHRRCTSRKFKLCLESPRTKVDIAEGCSRPSSRIMLSLWHLRSFIFIRLVLSFSAKAPLRVRGPNLTSLNATLPPRQETHKTSIYFSIDMGFIIFTKTKNEKERVCLSGEKYQHNFNLNALRQINKSVPLT